MWNLAPSLWLYGSVKSTRVINFGHFPCVNLHLSPFVSQVTGRVGTCPMVAKPIGGWNMLKRCNNHWSEGCVQGCPGMCRENRTGLGQLWGTGLTMTKPSPSGWYIWTREGVPPGSPGWNPCRSFVVDATATNWDGAMRTAGVDLSRLWPTNFDAPAVGLMPDICNLCRQIPDYIRLQTSDIIWSSDQTEWIHERMVFRHVSPMFSFRPCDYDDSDSWICTFRNNKPETSGHHLDLNLTTVVHSCCLLCATLWVWLLHFAHPANHGSLPPNTTKYWFPADFPSNNSGTSRSSFIFLGGVFCGGGKCVNQKTLLWDHLPLSSWTIGVAYL